MIDFGWGRFYVGGGIGAARVQTEVEFERTRRSRWWTPSGRPRRRSRRGSPSPASRAASSRTIGYRFRWVGDVESGTFPTGEKVRYKNFNIHDFMFGFTDPARRGRRGVRACRLRRLRARSPRCSAGEELWTGFHVGAFGGWGKSEDFDASSSRRPAARPTTPDTSYGIDGDGALGGGEIGVDWQWRWLVLGLSGEVRRFSTSTAPPPTRRRPAATRKTSFSTDWYGGMSVRGGLAYDRLLAFGRVGALYLNAEAKTTDSCTLPHAARQTASASEEDILFGWFLGAGLEYSLQPALERRRGIPLSSTSTTICSRPARRARSEHVSQNVNIKRRPRRPRLHQFPLVRCRPAA